MVSREFTSKERVENFSKNYSEHDFDFFTLKINLMKKIEISI